MNNWTHAICPRCWNKREPDRRPITLTDKKAEICCFCDMPTGAGIYLREDPAKTLCGGAHE